MKYSSFERRWGGDLDKQAIFKRVAQVEEQIGELYKELGGLKTEIVQLMEENTRLTLENDQLRKLQQEVSHENASSYTDEAGQTTLHQSIGNHHLMNLYDEGFHICNVHYGRMRTDGNCLFCIAFLDKTKED
jgi:regulator of replication initiation timing